MNIRIRLARLIGGRLLDDYIQTFTRRADDLLRTNYDLVRVAEESKESARTAYNRGYEEGYSAKKVYVNTIRAHKLFFEYKAGLHSDIQKLLT